MAKKQTVRKVRETRKNNPKLLGLEQLDFSGDGSNTIEPNHKEQAYVFVSKWYEAVDPWIAYPKYFEQILENDEDKMNIFIGFVKTYYIQYVIKKGWSEKKYVLILDHLLYNNMHISTKTLDELDILYKNERLVAQQREKKLRGRKKRI